MKKKILIGLVVVILVAAVVVTLFMSAMSQPFYKPGMVREGKNLRAPLTPPAQLGNPDFWQVESDIQLHHFSHGAGRVVLVIHGGPGVPFLQPMSGLESLAGEYQFHYYDQRGSGQSTRPFDRFDSPNTYENMTALEQTLGLGAQIADIERIRQILGEEKLILVGHSWGGFLASLYAAEFPERVEALILVSPATMLVMPQEEADLFDTVRARLPQGEQAAFDAFMDDYFDFGSGLFQKSEADLIAMQVQFAEYYGVAMEINTTFPEQGQPGGWMVWAQYLSLGQKHDYRPALQKVAVPALVLHGADDLQSESASRAYAEVFPNAQFAVIAEASHFSFEEQPEEFARLVAEFLAGLK